MQPQLIKIKDLKNNTGQIDGLPKNPRILKDDKFIKLKKSLEDDPEMLELREVIAYDNNGELIVICGNMRLKALKELGIKEVPTKILPTETSVEKLKAYTIKDNVSFGDHDWNLLANEWNSEELESWGLDLPAFETDEVLEAKEDNFDATPPEQPITVLGDLYEIGEHRLLCGDSTQTDSYEKLFNGNLADLVVTDPPYNVDYGSKAEAINKYGYKFSDRHIKNDYMPEEQFVNFLDKAFKNMSESLKNGGSFYIFHASITVFEFEYALRLNELKTRQQLIWVKNAIVLGRQDYQWKHEPCLYGWKEGAAHYFTNERNHTTVIEDAININKLTKDQMKKMLNEMLSDKTKSTIIKCDKPSKNDVHPTMKPILLLAPLIENSSKAGEIVADGFLGSGSTMVAAHQLKRKCYGMELDCKYVDVIVKRMLKLDKTLKIKKNGIDETETWLKLIE